MINRYTVIGQPIAHSLSPVVHQLFGEHTQRRVHYTRTESTPDSFESTVREWLASGAKGCNITSPFKEQAAQLCDRLSPQAQRAASVNTIKFLGDGTFHGHTTDGKGLVIDIEKNLRQPMQNKRVLILGAGGAARGVMQAILECDPACLHIANRTAEKAEQLAALFEDLGPTSGGGYEALHGMDAFDVVINATTLSMQGKLPDLPEQLLAKEALGYDMTYANRETLFMAWARTHGATTANGLGMLVEQAAEAFFIWEDVRPKTRMVYPRLHEMLGT